MPKLSRILVPVDFSECSWAALSKAAEIAKGFQAQIHLLHIWQTPPYVDASTTIQVSGREQTLSAFVKTEAGKDMKRFMASVENEIEAMARIEAGDPTETIIELANAGDYDLIVMGTHGRRGLSHLLLGSIAEKVVRRSAIPVMTVRDSGKKGE